MKGDWILLITATLVGLPRVFGYKSIPYQAIAHIYVGLLFGMYFMIDKKIPGNRHLLYAAAYLTLLETVCFIAAREH